MGPAARTSASTRATPDTTRGNCIIRAATRRRYPASQLLMLQNPHRRRCGGCRGTAKFGGGDGAGGRARAGGSSGPAGATKFARYALSPTQPMTKFAQQPQKRQIWGVSSAQGELFHAHTHDQAVLGDLFRAPDARRATLKPTTPLQSLIRANMKPTPPLRAPEQQPLKPTTPLQPKTVPKMPVS